MSQTATQEASQPVAVPPIVDQETWDAALADLRAREKAATRSSMPSPPHAGVCRWWNCRTTPSKAPTDPFGSWTSSKASTS